MNFNFASNNQRRFGFGPSIVNPRQYSTGYGLYPQKFDILTNTNHVTFDNVVINPTKSFTNPNYVNKNNPKYLAPSLAGIVKIDSREGYQRDTTVVDVSSKSSHNHSNAWKWNQNSQAYKNLLHNATNNLNHKIDTKNFVIDIDIHDTPTVNDIGHTDDHRNDPLNALDENNHRLNSAPNTDNHHDPDTKNPQSDAKIQNAESKHQSDTENSQSNLKTPNIEPENELLTEHNELNTENHNLNTEYHHDTKMTRNEPKIHDTKSKRVLDTEFNELDTENHRLDTKTTRTEPKIHDTDSKQGLDEFHTENHNLDENNKSKLNNNKWQLKNHVVDLKCKLHTTNHKLDADDHKSDVEKSEEQIENQLSELNRKSDEDVKLDSKSASDTIQHKFENNQIDTDSENPMLENHTAQLNCILRTNHKLDSPVDKTVKRDNGLCLNSRKMDSDNHNPRLNHRTELDDRKSCLKDRRADGRTHKSGKKNNKTKKDHKSGLENHKTKTDDKTDDHRVAPRNFKICIANHKKIPINIVFTRNRCYDCKTDEDNRKITEEYYEKNVDGIKEKPSSPKMGRKSKRNRKRNKKNKKKCSDKTKKSKGKKKSERPWHKTKQDFDLSESTLDSDSSNMIDEPDKPFCITITSTPKSSPILIGTPSIVMEASLTKSSPIVLKSSPIDIKTMSISPCHHELLKSLSISSSISSRSDGSLKCDNSSVCSNKSDSSSICSFVSSSPVFRRLRMPSECESEDSFIVFRRGGDSTDDDEDDSDFDESETDDTEQSDCDVEFNGGDERNCDISTNRKKVTFKCDSELCEVHPMIKWGYAYHTARVGPWEQLARDRARFEARIKKTGEALSLILSPKHRERMYEDRFQDRNHQ